MGSDHGQSACTNPSSSAGAYAEAMKKSTPDGQSQSPEITIISGTEEEPPMQETEAAPRATESSTPRQKRHRMPRVRACSQCKKLKIRCEVRRGEAACVRCLRTGVECMAHDPAQKMMDEDNAWKAQATAQINQLQLAMAAVLQRDQLPDLSSFNTIKVVSSVSPADSALGSVSNAVIAPIDMDTRESRHHSPESRHNSDPGLVQAPMRNLYDLTGATSHGHAAFSRDQASPMEEDLIAKGILTVEQGEELLNRFLHDHHPLLWGGVIFPQRTLESLRRASILLSTAVFTVAALHSPDPQPAGILQRCYDALVSLAGHTMLSRGQNLDDIRGLCLGAFYLPNLSWRFVGQAVRIASEMNIHQSFRKLLDGDVRHHERVRLWYSLYVCDRHFSILYGRPSAIYDDASIRGVEEFLKSPAATPSDIRLSAQVSLFKILSDVYHEFGGDQHRVLSDQDIDKLRIYNLAIEQWRHLWQARSHDEPGIGTYPSMGVVMFYHFARFQLNSLAFRGVRWPSEEPQQSWLNRREAAMTAISSAMSTLIHILVEGDLRRHFRGVPLFSYAMVAFCSTFLLKMVTLWGRGGESMSHTSGLGLYINTGEVISLTTRAADLLTEVAGQVSEKHLSHLLAAGIREMLQRVGAPDEPSLGASALASVPGPMSKLPLGRGPGATVAADFATEQMGEGMHDMVYNMDLDSLVGFFEFGSEETFLNGGGGNFAQPEGEMGWGPS